MFGGESSRGGSGGKRSHFAPGDSRRPVVSGSARPFSRGAASSGSVSSAPQCALCGRRHFGRCLGAGRCFQCGQVGHKAAECQQRFQEGRSSAGAGGEQRFGGPPRAAPPRASSEGSSFGRGGGRFGGRQSAGRGVSSPSTSVVPAQPRVFSLSQQEARDSPDVVAGTISISAQPCSVLFDSGASLSFVVEHFLDCVGVVPSFLTRGLSVRLPTGDSVLASLLCACEVEIAGRRLATELLVLPLSEFDVILGMDWLGKYRALIDCN